jgi:hypothetical protein
MHLNNRHGQTANSARLRVCSRSGLRRVHFAYLTGALPPVFAWGAGRARGAERAETHERRRDRTKPNESERESEESTTEETEMKPTPTPKPTPIKNYEALVLAIKLGFNPQP